MDIESNNMKKETIIISGFMGFAIGVCTMMFISINKESRLLEEIKRLEIQESHLELYYDECEDCLLYSPCDVCN